MKIQVVITHRHIISQEPVRRLLITVVLQLLPKVRRRPDQVQHTVGPVAHPNLQALTAGPAAVPAEVAALTAHQKEAVLPTVHPAEAVAASPTVRQAEAVAAGPTVLQAVAAVPAVRVARVAQVQAQAEVQEVHLLQGDRLSLSKPPTGGHFQ